MAQILDFAAAKARSQRQPAGPVLFLKPVSGRKAKKAEKAAAVRQNGKAWI